MITPVATAEEGEIEQAGGGAVLSKDSLHPVKELSGELNSLHNLCP